MTKERIRLQNRGTADAVSSFWNESVFEWVIAACLLFVLLTTGAMLLYPGGTWARPASPGYSFFQNLLSDLGFFRSHNGMPNRASLGLFMLATTTAGIALMMFSLAFVQFFTQRSARILGSAASVLGVLSGISFMGVGLTPADICLHAHFEFVGWGFRAFSLGAFCYSMAIFRQPGYPRRYAYVFLGTAVLLLAYVLLLRFGPDLATFPGTVVHATGQKAVVYSAILSIAVESMGARQVAAARFKRRWRPLPVESYELP
jgi:hypothetical membrane protein